MVELRVRLFNQLTMILCIVIIMLKGRGNMNKSINKMCVTAMGIALFVVLSYCVQVPVFENYYLCFGYVAMTVFCYYYGPISGMTVGVFGVFLYCLLISGLHGMPGWAIGNIVIGFIVGFTCKITSKMKKQKLRHFFIGISIVFSVAIGMIGAKSIVETLLYAQPIILRVGKNLYAFVADVIVMLISLPICVSLKKVMPKYFE